MSNRIALLTEDGDVEEVDPRQERKERDRVRREERAEKAEEERAKREEEKQRREEERNQKAEERKRKQDERKQDVEQRREERKQQAEEAREERKQRRLERVQQNEERKQKRQEMMDERDRTKHLGPEDEEETGKKNFFKTKATSKNEMLAAIKIGGRGHHLLKIEYTKITNGRTNEYIVEPYSYRFRPVRLGVKKMLMAYDTGQIRNSDSKGANTIKGFLLARLKSVQILNETFSPRWRVEF